MLKEKTSMYKKSRRKYEKVIEMSRNNDYTTGNLLDYKYFSKHYKPNAVDLSEKILI